MALSEDQRAMLRLLAQREQGYEDIAALMGLSVEEVRARVGEALAQLESEGAEPPAPPPPEPEPEPEPAPVEPPAPEPEQPPQPAPAPAPPPAPASAAPGSSRPPRLSLPSENGPRAAIAAGLAAVVAIVVVLLVGGGDDSGSGTAAAEPEAADTAQTASSDPQTEPTVAVLKPVDGSDASGTAAFLGVDDNLVLAIEAKGLRPSSKDEQYAVAIAASPQQILPIASTAVGKKGTIEASVQLPAELLFFLADETYSEIFITRADTARLEAEIRKGAKEPSYTGTPVLRGRITGPLVGNEELVRQIEEAKAAEGEGGE